MAASSAFDFPQVYEFAPFFTLQPNPTSRSEQLGLWRELILSYCAHHRIFYLDLSPTLPLFNNARISRKLSQESIRQVVADLVANRQAVWEGGNAATATRALIYWRTPVQWANAIYSWVTVTGQNKSIMTLFELTQGDLVQGQDFCHLPIPLLKEAIQYLSTQGKAQIFAGTEAEDGEGVKFV